VLAPALPREASKREGRVHKDSLISQLRAEFPQLPHLVKEQAEAKGRVKELSGMNSKGD
jgi:hypothetical protein